MIQDNRYIAELVDSVDHNSMTYKYKIYHTQI